MIIKGATVFFEDAFKKVDLEIVDGKFVRIEEDIESDDFITLNDKIIIPGLVDIHTHGAMGYDFGECSCDEIKKLAEYYVINGTTSLLPTLVTLDKCDYEKQLKNITSNYCAESPFVGINLEGPFISTQKKGAHNADNIISIDCEFTEKLWELSNKSVKLMTVAPELDGLDELQEFAKDKFKLSLGHTACSYRTAKIAYDMGINHVTHLFNAMNLLHHREPSLIGLALEYPIIKELICDGIHVEPSIIKGLFRMCPEEIAIISDSISACGLGDGKYSLGGLLVTVKDRKSTLEDGTIAGSINTLYDNVKYLIDLGISKKQVINSATKIPARAINLENEIGSIKQGLKADFLICDEKFNLLGVYKNGIKKTAH